MSSIHEFVDVRHFPYCVQFSNNQHFFFIVRLGNLLLTLTQDKKNPLQFIYGIHRGKMSLDNINNMNTTVKINISTKAASKTCKIIDFSVRLSILVILNCETISSQGRISNLRHGRNWRGISVLYRSHKSDIQFKYCQGDSNTTRDSFGLFYSSRDSLYLIQIRQRVRIC